MRLKNAAPMKGRDGSRRLVVLVHGWAMWPLVSLRDVEGAINDALPDADILAPRYPSHATSNADPVEVADALSRTIQQAVDARRESTEGYQEIVLVGFSSGALMARKAYVFARGQSHDGSAVAAIAPRDWPALVHRIVLLAGTNRGWSLDPKPRHMRRALHVLSHVLLMAARILRFGRYARAIERGSPFVANLRLQWLALEQGDEPPPLTVQLLGDRDDVVDTEDNIDIQVSARFAFLPIEETGHTGIVDFREAGVGPRRRAAFLRALTAPEAELRRAGSDLPAVDREHDAEVRVATQQPVGGLLNAPDTDASVTDVIFVMHGIRDYGQWTTRLREATKEVVAAHNGGVPEADRRKVVVVTSRYGRFPLSGFLMTAARRAKVRWFADLYTQMAARYPKARRHFIGHSNGTYLLAGALREYAAMSFHRVAFAGSVVPRDFPWDDQVSRRRIEALRNDLASSDLVVATFPRFFEQIRDATGLPLSDVGSGGFTGFEQYEGNRHEVAYIEGGHGAAISPGNHGSLIRFVLGIDAHPVVDVDKVKMVDSPAPAAKLMTTLCGIVWAVLLAAPFALWYVAVRVWYLTVATPLDTSFSAWLGEQGAISWPVLLPALVVMLLVSWLLKTI